MDGHAVGLRGNPWHPVNRGALCPKAFGALQLLDDADRYRGPMVRDGERGSGRLKPIGWDEALDLLAKRLGDLRSHGLGHTVAILGGQYRGFRDVLWQRFAGAYGTPNYLRARCLAPERPALSHRLMHGVASPLAYDLEHANFVLAFGTGLFESWIGPVWAGKAFSALRGGRDRARGALVIVDPHRSLTAAVADRWVPIRPGTDGILALGIANVLLREDLYDRGFVERETAGSRIGPTRRAGSTGASRRSRSTTTGRWRWPRRPACPSTPSRRSPAIWPGGGLRS
jgi:anaerobic selenocysteine-containing dehydrogenase